MFDSDEITAEVAQFNARHAGMRMKAIWELFHWDTYLGVAVAVYSGAHVRRPPPALAPTDDVFAAHAVRIRPPTSDRGAVRRMMADCIRNLRQKYGLRGSRQ